MEKARLLAASPEAEPAYWARPSRRVAAGADVVAFVVTAMTNPSKDQATGLDVACSHAGVRGSGHHGPHQATLRAADPSVHRFRPHGACGNDGGRDGSHVDLRRP